MTNVRLPGRKSWYKQGPMLVWGKKIAFFGQMFVRGHGPMMWTCFMQSAYAPSKSQLVSFILGSEGLALGGLTCKDAGRLWGWTQGYPMSSSLSGQRLNFSLDPAPNWTQIEHIEETCESFSNSQYICLGGWTVMVQVILVSGESHCCFITGLFSWVIFLKTKQGN